MAKNRVVVTGLGIFCPLGKNREEVFKAMWEKRSAITKLELFGTKGLSNFQGAEFRDYTPSAELSAYALPVQYAICAARDALSDSGLIEQDLFAGKTGLSFATCNSDMISFEKPGKLVDVEKDAAFSLPHFQPGDALARYLGITGPVLNNATACAASGSAMAFAFELVAGGYAPSMLAGGADTLAESVLAGFNILQALSPEPCTPFGLPYGLNLGEGAAFVVLENLEQALGRGAHIYAEICGYGLSQDAYHVTAPHPEGEGVELAVAFALKHAAVGPEQVEYANVHGTGTEANDGAELEGLARLFGPECFPRLYISSCKSYYGHTLGAAAVLEYVTTLIALQKNRLPATLHTTKLRAGCTEARLVLDQMVEACPEYFLCINSAFGGHNSAILSRNWNSRLNKRTLLPLPLQLQTEHKLQDAAQWQRLNPTPYPFRQDKPRRVIIAGMGMANHFGCLPGGRMKDFHFAADNIISMQTYRAEIKGYIGPYYTRRMNSLTQFSIAAAHLALSDAGLEPGDGDRAPHTGLIYGTTFGTYYGLSRYLEPFFAKGPAHASALYFPDTVLNSTPGKVSARLGGMRGYGSTFSTGGNEGLVAAFGAYEIIANGYQRYCLAGTGEEISDLRGELSRVLGYDRSVFPLTEGSCFLLLTHLERAEKEGLPVYAELKGFGFSFCPAGSSANDLSLRRAVEMALERSGTRAEQVDFVYYNDPGLDETGALDRWAIASIFSNCFPRDVPILSVNDLFGFAFAVSSMYHLSLAASCLAGREEWQRGIVVTSSYNGSNVVAVLGKV